MSLPARRTRLLRGVATLAGLVLAFFVAATIGAREAARDTRALQGLRPVFDALADGAVQAMIWMAAHLGEIGWGILVVGAVVAGVGFLARRTRALPVALLVAAVVLAAWGQIFLLRDRVDVGLSFYVAAVIAALLLGVWCPAPWRSLQSPARRLDGVDFAAMAVFGCAAIVTRTYALNHLPGTFTGEMIVSMLASRSFAGLREYVPSALIGNSNGLVHLLPQMGMFELYGTSIYSLRLAGALFGSLVIPLFYWLLLRLAGRPAACAGTMLMLTAPEQLYWSRFDGTAFAPMAVLGVLSAHFALWMLEGFSFASVVSLALVTGSGRLFYAAGAALVVYPGLLYAHALVFVRGAWRAALRVVPGLLLGFAIWVGGLTAVNYAVTGNRNFVNPASHGESIWMRGDVIANGPLDLLLLQGRSLAENFGKIAASAAYRTGFSEWYGRYQIPDDPHQTMLNVGVAVLGALALGYLLGQLNRPQAFLLLSWFGLGLLPGVLSAAAVDRRLCVAFPALYAMAGVAIGGFVRLARERGGRFAGTIAAVAVAMGILLISWTSLASHFKVFAAPQAVDGLVRFTKPMIEEHETIYHKIDPTVALVLGFGHADQLLRSGSVPCIQFVPPRKLLSSALRQSCDYSEPLYRFLLSPARIASLRDSFRPGRLGFLLENRPTSQPYLDILSALFPNADLKRYPGRNGEYAMTAVSVDADEVLRARSPVLVAAPLDTDPQALANTLLSGTHLRVEGARRDGRTVVSGGLLIDEDGWFAVGLEPPCPGAILEIDGARASSEAVQPMLEGVHAFSLSLAEGVRCELPIRISLKQRVGRNLEAVEQPLLVAPETAATSVLKSPPMKIFAGYGPAKRFAERQGTVVDFGIDDDDLLRAIVDDGGKLNEVRYDLDGYQLGTKSLPVPPGRYIKASAMGPDGAWLLAFDRTTLILDRDGKVAAEWLDAPITTPAPLLLPNGNVATCIPHHGSVAVLGADGQIVDERNTYSGTSRFFEPISLALSPRGDLVVVQTDGKAILFETSGVLLAPTFVRQFTVKLAQAASHAHGTTFDGDRIVLTDSSGPTALVYDLEGHRLMARDREHDLSTRGFGDATRFLARHDRLFVLTGRREIWVLPRVTEAQAKGT